MGRDKRTSQGHVSHALGFLADSELAARLGVDGTSQTGHSSVTKVHTHLPKGWGGGVLLWAFREENAQSSRETSSSSGCIKEDETGQGRDHLCEESGEEAGQRWHLSWPFKGGFVTCTRPQVGAPSAHRTG